IFFSPKDQKSSEFQTFSSRVQKAISMFHLIDFKIFTVGLGSWLPSFIGYFFLIGILNIPPFFRVIRFPFTVM
ncbi:hypothetical protein AB4369_24155, partial [Vibrio sp. 10N.261.49.A5]|uniref:hypothetical protein n=1 Tax=Vibrio sp. 10N.261.49.A5 TaxID=3229670 RepID=UPI00354C41AC